MKKQIWKFQLSVEYNKEIEMPEGAEILSVQMQAGEIAMWAICDTAAKMVKRKFDIVGTGWTYTFDNKKFIGTIQDGIYVWHVFEIINVKYS